MENTNRYKIKLEYFNETKEGGTEGYTVTVPTLRGAVTWGETRAHALEMAQDCVEVYLDSLREDGLPIPPGDVPNEAPDELTVEVRELAAA